MTKEVLAVREAAGKRNYFFKNPLATCSMTGVQVKYLGGIHYWDHKVYIYAKTPFADANEEMNFIIKDCDAQKQASDTESCDRNDEERIESDDDRQRTDGNLEPENADDASVVLELGEIAFDRDIERGRQSQSGDSKMLCVMTTGKAHVLRMVPFKGGLLHL